MADLSTYQKAADAIYNPQLDAEMAQNSQSLKNAQAALDSEQTGIEPAYQTAIRNLNDQTLQNEGKINQLYSQRLGGQFSGLQGNDMGMMYSKATQAKSDIETSRANKLADIASRRTLAQGTYDTNANALRSKYSGMKAQYAQDNYNDAIKQEQANAAAIKAASIKSAAASAAQSDPTAPFTSAFAAWMKNQGKMASRQAQDAYINSLFDNYGIKSNDARQVVWNAINAQFNRVGDPTKDWTYKR